MGVNNTMGALQKQQLERTPFCWMLLIADPLKICSALLLELVSRWSVENKSFRIREHLVPFNVFDVCVVLDFSVRVNLFGNEEIIIEKIVLKLQEEDNVDNYCRLYILLMFSVFLLSSHL